MPGPARRSGTPPRSSARSLGRLALRASGAVLLFASLAGNAPGSVGGCNTEIPFVPDVEFCQRREVAICTRDREAGRIDETGFVVCANGDAVDARCAGFRADCDIPEPRVRECENLLLSQENLSVSTEQLLQTRPECNVCRP